jgi:Domain of unknown function (DUF4845)
MATRQHQSGMSILGILAILIMLGFFAMNIIRMTPPFLEYLSVKDVIARTAMDSETVELSNSDIRRKISKIFNTNQIYLLDAKDIEIFSKGGKTFIDANYEVRLPVVWKIDSILTFDDLLYEVGNPEPLPPLPPEPEK